MLSSDPQNLLSYTKHESQTPNLLFVFNARQMSFLARKQRELQTDQVWFCGYTEAEIAPMLNRIIRETNYQNYFVTSDDALITISNFKKLESALNHYEVVSSYGVPFQDKKHLSFYTKPSKTITSSGAYPPTEPSSDYEDILNFLENGEEFADCTFNGFFFCGASKKIWEKFPFVFRRGGSDLAWAEVVVKHHKMKIVKSAPCLHLCSIRTRLDGGYSFSNKWKKKQEVVFHSEIQDRWVNLVLGKKIEESGDIEITL